MSVFPVPRSPNTAGCSTVFSQKYHHALALVLGSLLVSLLTTAGKTTTGNRAYRPREHILVSIFSWSQLIQESGALRTLKRIYFAIIKSASWPEQFKHLNCPCAIGYLLVTQRTEDITYKEGATSVAFTITIQKI